MHVSKVTNGVRTHLLDVDPLHGFILSDEWCRCGYDLGLFVRRMRSLLEIQKITDLAELPEYLSDEDSRVTEAAKLKLDELTG